MHVFNEYNVKLLGSYAPNHIKKIVTGSGKAKKKKIIETISTIYSVDDLQKDEADAAAIAHTGMWHYLDNRKEDTA